MVLGSGFGVSREKTPRAKTTSGTRGESRLAAGRESIHQSIKAASTTTTKRVGTVRAPAYHQEGAGKCQCACSPAVGEEEVTRLRVLVDELDKLPERALPPEVEHGQVGQVGVTALHRLYQRALVLAHRRQQRHLLSRLV
eukprot:5285686-Pyramimonas_sp.AAC.1